MAALSTTRRKLALAGIVVVALGVAGGVGGLAYARSLVRAKLQAIATAAGLTLKVDDISVALQGRVTLTDVHLGRADGSDFVAAREVIAEISPTAAAAGSRRPERVQVAGLNVDIRVVDGRPQELIDLYRSVRSSRPAKPKEPGKTAPKHGTSLVVDGGEIRLSLVGKGAELLPKGLAVRGLAVQFDPDQGIGDVRATIDGSVKSKLQATLVPKKGAQPARVQARMSPELRINLPATNPLAKWVDAVVVGGFGYDAVSGPSVDRVALHKGKDKLLSVDRIATDDRALLAIRADGIAFTVPKALVAKVVKLPAEPPGLDILSGTIASAVLGTDSASKGGVWQAWLQGFELPLPAELGKATLKSAAITLNNPGAGVSAALQTLTLTEPALDLVVRESTWGALPITKRLYSAIHRAREGRVARRLAEQDADADEVDPADRPLPPEAEPTKAAKKPKKRRNKAREPWTAQWIKPLGAVHVQLLGIPDRIDKLIAAGQRVPKLAIEVTDGRIGLLDPVAEQPFGGLRGLSVKLTATLGDGTRGLELGARPFAGKDDLGELRLDLTSKSAATLDRLKVSAIGGGLAGIVSTIGASASVQPDAHLGVQASIARQENGDLLVTGELATKHIGLDWWRLAPRPIDDFDIDAKVKVRVARKPASIRIETTELTSGSAKAQALLHVADIGRKHATVRLLFELPKQDCGALAAAIPASMMPTIAGIKAKGELAMTFDLTIPLHQPYKGKLEASLDDAECEVESFGEVDVTKLAKPFSRPVNESGTILEDQLIGPQSEAWVDLASLPPWVPYAMIATEDAAFYHHRGVRLGLLGRAIKMCLDYGRFVYGGSTITQQLVKNIYLTRDKNLARKFEELLIVWQIERALTAAPDSVKEGEDPAFLRYVATKDRILELYINGIEFGPKLYGITRASRAYFGKEPHELSPLDASFLAANKPCPKCGHKRFTTQKWTPWWQERMVSIMSKMLRDGIIDDDQFAAEAPYVPRFVGWPGSEQKEPGSDIGGVEE